MALTFDAPAIIASLLKRSYLPRRCCSIDDFLCVGVRATASFAKHEQHAHLKERRRRAAAARVRLLAQTRSTASPRHHDHDRDEKRQRRGQQHAQLAADARAYRAAI